VKDAQGHEAEDKARRELIDARNQADSLAYQVEKTVHENREKLPVGDDRPVLVFEFSSSKNQSGQGSDFERALKLARYLSSREASAAKTVAYIPHSLKGHAVLVAMACEEIIMAPEALIGDAGMDEPAEEGIDPTILSGYREIANRRRTIPAEGGRRGRKCH